LCGIRLHHSVCQQRCCGIVVCAFVAVADSPCHDDEPKSKSDGPCDTPVTSRVSSEMSAAAEVRSGALASSQISQQPVVNPASQQSGLCTVKTTASGPAASESLREATAGCALMTSRTSVPLVGTDPYCDLSTMLHRPDIAQPTNAWIPLNALLPRNETTNIPPSSLVLDGSICANRQSSTSPEIDVLPSVKRIRSTSDHSSAMSSSGLAGEQAVQCPGSRVCNDNSDTVEPNVTQPSVYRCGSPSLDEDGEFSCRRLKNDLAAVVRSPSSTAGGGVKLIPLSQVISSETAAESLPVKTSRVDKVSVEAIGNKVPNNQTVRSAPTLHQQTESKAGRRRSSRLRVPKSVSDRAKQSASDGTRAAKFSISFSSAKPTEKDVCGQQAMTQKAVSRRQSVQQDSEEIACPSVTSRAGSGINEEDKSDVMTAKVPQHVRCGQQDVEPVCWQRLPSAWERRTKSSPVTSRRTSDRLKQKENDAPPSDYQKSPPAANGRKRMASSGSSGPSSCEKKSAKKVARTIAESGMSDEVRQKENDPQLSGCDKAPSSAADRKRSASSGSSGPSSSEKSAKKVTRTIAMTSLHSE